MRREIVEAAGASFGRVGYDGTTFARVAHAIGRPKSAIGYHLFPSKAALAEAVVAEADARWHKALEVLDRIDVPRGAERLVTMLLLTIRDAQRHPGRAGALRLLLDRQTPDNRDRSAERRGFVLTCLAHELGVGSPADALEVECAADLLVDATSGVALCHLGRDGTGAGGLDTRLCVLWASLLRDAGVDDASALVRRVRESSLTREIERTVEEELLDDEQIQAGWMPT